MADKAFLCGINSYPGAPLDGCVNDVLDMAKLLTEKFKFEAASIRMLVDGRATTKAILQRLDWLTYNVKAGDRILFHYSGHGTQVADRSGDEVDGLDEVICPVDFDWEAEHLITDDVLGEFFMRIPSGAHCVWISDSCHSGSLTRDFFEVDEGHGQPVGVSFKRGEVRRTRYLMPPADLAWRHRVAHETKKPIRPIKTAQRNVAFVSGCRDNQTSADAVFNKRPNGALTYYFLKSIQKLPGQPFHALVADTRKALKKAGYGQVPQEDGLQVNQPFLGGVKKGDV